MRPTKEHDTRKHPKSSTASISKIPFAAMSTHQPQHATSNTTLRQLKSQPFHTSHLGTHPFMATPPKASGTRWDTDTYTNRPTFAFAAWVAPTKCGAKQNEKESQINPYQLTLMPGRSTPRSCEYVCKHLLEGDRWRMQFREGK